MPLSIPISDAVSIAEGILRGFTPVVDAADPASIEKTPSVAAIADNCGDRPAVAVGEL